MCPLSAGPLPAQFRECAGSRCLSAVMYAMIQLLLQNKLCLFGAHAFLFEESELHLLLHNHHPLKPQSPSVVDPARI